MASPPPTIDTEHLEVCLKGAGNFLRTRAYNNAVRGKSKNTFKEVVTDEDHEVQKMLYEALKRKYPDFVFVGEEDIGNGCLTEFPEPLDEHKVYCTLDPIDGSANYATTTTTRYAITVGFQKGSKPFFGMVHFPGLKDLFIMGGTGYPVTIKGGSLNPPRNYDAKNIHLAYGEGNRKPEAERKKFANLIMSLAEDYARFGCASFSLLQVLQGNCDGYVSLKEKWTNICPWQAILSGIPSDGNGNRKWKINVDPAELNLNEPFCMAVATHDFWEAHLKPGSDLAACLKN